MCEFCAQHGEGQKWYLPMKNYSREQYEYKNSKEHIRQFMESFEESNPKSIAQLDGLRKHPVVYRFIRRMATSQQKANHLNCLKKKPR